MAASAQSEHKCLTTNKPDEDSTVMRRAAMKSLNDGDLFIRVDTGGVYTVVTVLECVKTRVIRLDRFYHGGKRVVTPGDFNHTNAAFFDGELCFTIKRKAESEHESYVTPRVYERRTEQIRLAIRSMEALKGCYLDMHADTTPEEVRELRPIATSDGSVEWQVATVSAVRQAPGIVPVPGGEEPHHVPLHCKGEVISSLYADTSEGTFFDVAVRTSVTDVAQFRVGPITFFGCVRQDAWALRVRHAVVSKLVRPDLRADLRINVHQVDSLEVGFKHRALVVWVLVNNEVFKGLPLDLLRGVFMLCVKGREISCDRAVTPTCDLGVNNNSH
jgi:hypothetical protein